VFKEVNLWQQQTGGKVEEVEEAPAEQTMTAAPPRPQRRPARPACVQPQTDALRI